MDKTFQDKWVAALRSGEYEQGCMALGHLPIGGGRIRFCCLGVACELLVAEKRAKRFDSYVVCGSYQYGERGCVTSKTLITPELREKIGLGQSNAARFANMNDQGSSFEEIADEIEKL